MRSIRRSAATHEARGGGRPRALLLLLAAACQLVAWVRADPIVGTWNKIVIDAMVHQRIGANAGLAPLPPVANVLEAGRILSILHVAQWQAANAVLAANNVTTMDEAKARLADLLPALQAAVAGAGQAVIAAELPEKDYRAQALFAAQAGDAAAGSEAAAAVALGAAAAQEVLALRAADGADAHPGRRGYKGANETGKWRPTPPAFAPGGGVQWAKVTPWVMDSPEELRPPKPPALKSEQYKQSYMMAMSVGNATSATRTAAHTEEVLLWNEFPDALLFSIVDQATNESDILDATRIYAMVGVAGVDARVCAFDAKYHYSAWRPVTAIPLGNGVGFPADPAFAPVVSTPPTPEYPSAHTTYGEAVLEVLRRARGGGGAAPTKAAADAADALALRVTSPVPLPVVKQPAPQAQAQSPAPSPPAPAPQAQSPPAAQPQPQPGQRRGLQGEQQGQPPANEAAPVMRAYRTLTEAGDQLALSRVRAGVNFRFTANASVSAGRAVADRVWKGFDAKYTRSIKIAPPAETPAAAATATERKKAEHTRRALRTA